MEEDYRYAVPYNKKQQDKAAASKSQAQTLASLMHVITRDLNSAKNATQKPPTISQSQTSQASTASAVASMLAHQANQTNQANQSANSPQLIESVNLAEPAELSQLDQSEQHAKKSDDDEYLKKKHKIPRDRKDKDRKHKHSTSNDNLNYENTGDDLCNDLANEQINMEVDEDYCTDTHNLPTLIPAVVQTTPLASFASLEVQHAHQTSQQSQMGTEQKKYEDKQLSEVINDVRDIKLDLASTNLANVHLANTSVTSVATNSGASTVTNVSSQSVTSIDTDTIDSGNKISKSNILEQATMEKKINNAKPEILNMDQKDLFSYKDLIINLKYLASVEKNQKLSSSTGNLNADNMILGSVTRWWFKEGKDSTHDLIKKLIISAEFHSELLISQLKDQSMDPEKLVDVKRDLDGLTTDLGSSKKGIRNLIITYQGHDVFLAKLDVCWNEISVRTHKNMNFNVVKHSDQPRTSRSSSFKSEEKQENEQNDLFSYSDLIINLKYLADVEKFQKLSSDGNLDADNMMFGTITRWWFNYGKEQTHDIIKKLIKSAEFHSDSLISQLRDPTTSPDKLVDIKRNLDGLTTDLGSSLKGIRNLVITYQTFDVYLAKLDVCWDEISVRVHKNMNF